MEYLLQIALLTVQIMPQLRRQEECKGQNGWSILGEEDPLNKLKCSQTHTSSQTLKQQAQSVHYLNRVLCIQNIAFSLVCLWASRECDKMGLCFLCLLVPTFPSVGCLLQHHYDGFCFILSTFLSCLVVISQLSCPFLAFLSLFPSFLSFFCF